MWSRAELKTSAKQILQKNYWAAVLVALIVSFSSGATINLTSNFYNGTSTSQTLTTKDYESQMSGEISGGSESAVDYINQFADDFTNIFSENEIKILAMIILIIALISIAIRIFIFAPLQVGSYKWMLNNRITNPSLGQVADGFRYGYLNIVKVMFLKDLFEKQLDGEEAARKHLSFLGVEPKQYYFIMISGFTNVQSHSMTNTYYWNQLTSIFKNSITGVFGNRFVTLVSTSDKDSFFEKLSSRLETFLQMNHMLAAVSYSFDQLWDASVYAEQCNSLLTERLVVYNESPILFYEDYYLKHLINMTKNPAAIKASVHPDIKDMIKYDASQGTEYIHTLKTYFEHNRSMPATAKALFIHKSTLFYRFDKMKQLFNIDIIDAEKLFIYEYSLRILSV